MIATRSISTLTSIQSSLHAALEGATSYGDALIWNQVAKALGSVRIEIGRSQAEIGPDDRAKPLDAHPPQISATIPAASELKELIVAALVLAEALGQDGAALKLNEALIDVTGKGISPEGWSPV